MGVPSMANTWFLRCVELMHNHDYEVRTVLMGTGLETGQALGSVAGEPVGLETRPSEAGLWRVNQLTELSLLTTTIPTRKAFH